MQNDPIVQEVRSIRKEIEQQFPNANAYYQHLEQQQATYEQKLVKRQPRRSTRAQAS